jgi:hypothetical protein
MYLWCVNLAVETCHYFHSLQLQREGASRLPIGRSAIAPSLVKSVAYLSHITMSSSSAHGSEPSSAAVNKNITHDIRLIYAMTYGSTPPQTEDGTIDENGNRASADKGDTPATTGSTMASRSVLASGALNDQGSRSSRRWGHRAAMSSIEATDDDYVSGKSDERSRRYLELDDMGSKPKEDVSRTTLEVNGVSRDASDNAGSGT